MLRHGCELTFMVCGALFLKTLSVTQVDYIVSSNPSFIFFLVDEFQSICREHNEDDPLLGSHLF